MRRNGSLLVLEGVVGAVVLAELHGVFLLDDAVHAPEGGRLVGVFEGN